MKPLHERILFMGVAPGSGSGHYLFEPGWRQSYQFDRYNKGNDLGRTGIDGVFAPYMPGKREPQGQAAMHFVFGHTVVSFWDRSEDSRGGCCATFIAEGRYSFEEMMKAARKAYPRLFKRFTFDVVCLPQYRLFDKASDDPMREMQVKAEDLLVAIARGRG